MQLNNEEAKEMLFFRKYYVEGIDIEVNIEMEIRIEVETKGKGKRRRRRRQKMLWGGLLCSDDD